MPVVYAGVGGGNEHDGGVGCRRGSVEGAGGVVLAEDGDGCEDEGASAVCDGAGKARACLLGMDLEGGEIAIEFVPVVGEELSAGLCFIAGRLGPLRTGFEVGDEVLGGGGLCEDGELPLDGLEAFSGRGEFLLDGLLFAIAGCEESSELRVGRRGGVRGRGRRGRRHCWLCLGRDGLHRR